MEYDEDRVDDAVLALMYLGLHGPEYATRTWKGFDWDALDGLHNKDYITDPRSKAKSVIMTDEGLARSEELFRELFGT